VFWLSISLIIFIVSGLVALVAPAVPAVWTYARHVTRFGLQFSGVLAVAWLLVTMSANSRAAGLGIPGPASQAISSEVITAAWHSLLLLGVASVIGMGGGLWLAYSTTLLRHGGASLALTATVVLAVPTFLIAIVAETLQGDVYSLTGLTTSGGFGHLNALALFWAAFVVGLRPAAYVYRHARLDLELASLADHVRVAKSRGLLERQIAYRYIFRPALPTLIAGALNSLRLMIGSLPLVEYFFAYPGLGQLLIFSFGIGYQGGGVPAFNPTLTVVVVAAIAALLLLGEAAARVFQQLLDPRLNELRAEI
jgi:ABC-type dipeptide/oligopeptide/nickel transport system permease component